jgi:hypothetical protein
MSVRERIARVFSREVLGVTFVGLSAGKIVETAIGLLPAVPAVRFVGWGATFVAAVALRRLEVRRTGRRRHDRGGS